MGVRHRQTPVLLVGDLCRGFKNCNRFAERSSHWDGAVLTKRRPLPPSLSQDGRAELAVQAALRGLSQCHGGVGRSTEPSGAAGRKSNLGRSLGRRRSEGMGSTGQSRGRAARHPGSSEGRKDTA